MSKPEVIEVLESTADGEEIELVLEIKVRVKVKDLMQGTPLPLVCPQPYQWWPYPVTVPSPIKTWPYTITTTAMINDQTFTIPDNGAAKSIYSVIENSLPYKLDLSYTADKDGGL